MNDWGTAVQAVGLLLIGVGVGLVSVPAALIVVGALLFLLATWAEVLSMRGKDDHGTAD